MTTNIANIRYQSVNDVYDSLVGGQSIAEFVSVSREAGETTPEQMARSYANAFAPGQNLAAWLRELIALARDQDDDGTYADWSDDELGDHIRDDIADALTAAIEDHLADQGN